MKDISSVSLIIPDKLATFVYKQDGGVDTLHKILSEWRDVEYIFNFYEKNSRIIQAGPMSPYGYSFEDFYEEIMLDLE